MAHENKPSIFADRGGMGSAEELDKYGVWVKSEPQEMSFNGENGGEFAGMPLPDFGETPDFAAGSSTVELSFPDDAFAEEPPLPDIMDLSIPEPGVETEEALAIPDIDFPEDSGDEVLRDEVSGDSSAALDAGPAAAGAPASGDLSTQLLMKIADELSSIRNELATLKKEFAGLQSLGGEKAEAGQGGFFNEADDEKIALTGDEMDTILHTAELDETDGAFDQADADAFPADSLEALAEEPAAPEPDELIIETLDTPDLPDTMDSPDTMDTPDTMDLPEAAETEAVQAGDEAEAEEIEIDLEDLGINLDDIASGVDEAEAPCEDAAGDDVFDIDISPEEEIEPIVAETAAEEAVTVIEEDTDVLQQIREEGVAPMAPPPPPEGTAYLEDDPLAGFSAEITLEGEDGPEAEIAAAPDEALDISLDEASLELDIDEAVFDELKEDAAPAEGDSADEPPFDAAAFDTASDGDAAGEEAIDLSIPDLSIPDLSIPDLSGTEDLPELDEALVDVPAADDGMASEDTAAGDAVDSFAEEALEAPELSAEITESLADESALDEIALDGELAIELEDDGDEVEAALDARDEDAALPAGMEETLEIDLGNTGDIAQVIPEGFELAAEERPVPFDDDMEPFAEEDIAAVAPLEEAPPKAEAAGEEAAAAESLDIPSGLKTELKNVLSYMDHLLESLPEEKIEEFAKSEYFDSYRKLFKELGLV
jgi:hypothetical protein